MAISPVNHVVIIGGGAAGFFAAIQAKQSNPALSVTILEAAARCLGKVKISGGGRCNVTHACFDMSRLVEHYPRGARELKGVFSRFGPADTVAWFKAHGMALKTEDDGRMFPVSDDSQTIIDCLLSTARGQGISIRTQTPVSGIRKLNTGFEVQLPHHETLQADALVVATGSNRLGYGWAKQLGHTLVEPVPSLFTFTIDDPSLTALTGTPLNPVVAKLIIPGHKKPLTQTGPVLITHQGLSGPAILKLSAWGAQLLAESNYQATVVLDLAPDLTQDDVRENLLMLKQSHPQKLVGTDAPVPQLTRRFWQWLAAQHGDVSPQSPWQGVTQKQCNVLAQTLKHLALPIAGINRYQAEFVTAGGIPLNEIDLRTMQSKRCPGLYFAGEIINVDGVTGGFNFQNAWSTGWIAGEQIAGLD